MVPDSVEAGLIQSRLITSTIGVPYVELVFSKKESAEDMVAKFNNKRV